MGLVTDEGWTTAEGEPTRPRRSADQRAHRCDTEHDNITPFMLYRSECARSVPVADPPSTLAPRFYKSTSSAIFLAMSSIESSSVLRPLREPRSGLMARISS